MGRRIGEHVYPTTGTTTSELDKCVSTHPVGPENALDSGRQEGGNQGPLHGQPPKHITIQAPPKTPIEETHPSRKNGHSLLLAGPRLH